MLLLFETAAGFGLFKVLDEKKIQQEENLEKLFTSKKEVCKVLQLLEFKKFEDSAEALQAGVALNEGKLCKPLKKLLKKAYVDDIKDKLMVWDPKLGTSIREKLNINVTTSGPVAELMRCIKCQIEPLIPGLDAKELSAMSLGLGHNLSRYKLKFSPDKVDTMIIHAINLLDDMDKEINNFIMRAREWYGWHFPELTKIIPDHTEYIRSILAIGTRENAVDTDLSSILSEEVALRVQEAAEVSMGTEICEEDIENIQSLCQEVDDLMKYRGDLHEYLMNRMAAISPNLSIIVGELVGARLISHAGSLLNLAKLPASTIQLLGAEKALFSALKSKKATPKYGIIYHASMVSGASVKYKGKVARMLANKAALAARSDALGVDRSLAYFNMANKERLVTRIRMLEEGYTGQISGLAKSQNKFDSYNRQSGDFNNFKKNENFEGKRKADFSEKDRPSKKGKWETITEDYTAKTENNTETPSRKIKKEKKLIEEVFPEVESSGKKKKKKKSVDELEVEDVPDVESSSKKNKKKIKHEKLDDDSFTEESAKRKKKLKSKKVLIEEMQSEEDNNVDVKSPELKKKKKKKRDKDSE